jgi:hypothetical protein
MTKTQRRAQARDIRAKLLERAEWIIDANIRASCGYIPQLPPDMVDFIGDQDTQRMIPEMKPLTDLLRAVIPKMELADDTQQLELQRAGDEVKATNAARAGQIVEECMRGEVSMINAQRALDLYKPLMEHDDRDRIVEAMNRLQQ